MSEARQFLEAIISDFEPLGFIRFFREKSRHFTSREEDYSRYNSDGFKNGIKLGEINFPESDSLLVCCFGTGKQLSERSGKKAQYDKAREILKAAENRRYSAGIFIFYDNNGSFRFSLVYDIPKPAGRRDWSNYKRLTYFVSNAPEITNKTFLKQIGDKPFQDLNDIKDAFSITAVTDLFYKEFFEIYRKVVDAVVSKNKINNSEVARDFVLLFTIRTIFIGFIQKRRWIGEDERFLQNFLNEYKTGFSGKDEFFHRWLEPLFFEALNSEQGRKVAYGDNDFSEKTELALQMAPYLNGGLFKPKTGYDGNGWIIPDKEIELFMDFLFSHSFTIEENSMDDEDLQLNPEFLGIIFERMVSKADGTVYTPRTEVDLMCRLSLVKWLQKNLDSKVKADNLYELFFKEGVREEDQKTGSFSLNEAKEILDKLEHLAICDLAVGSGAFLVGMMQVLDDVEQSLKERYKLSGKNTFERKKQIIKDTLYGVEVQEWSVWICHLRLWLSLFVDAPDDLRDSVEAILPSLDFKVRRGDSLVQRVGSKAFPVSLDMASSLTAKLTTLINLKQDCFDNKIKLDASDLHRREMEIYRDILDTEIKEKRNRIIALNRSAPVQRTLSGDDAPEQSKLGFTAELEKEIEELLEQQAIIFSGEKPLVWGIEFAEIFGEKNGFDIIISNPPYVRQEEVADPLGKIRDKKEYKSCLSEMVKLDFPDFFSQTTKINAKSDLYSYFYIRGLKLLNPKGIHTFICSNSWLDVGYGVWLQEFLLNRCPVDLIIDNHAKRSFGSADVNTIISIIHAPRKIMDPDRLVKFVAFKKPFEEAIFTENLLQIENAKKVESNDIFRVYPISNATLKEAGMEYEDKQNREIKTGKYVGDKWGGKYLRAPDIFFTILEKGKDKLVRLGDIADVRRGFTTGCNEFFYLTDERAREWGIEEEFLKPVIKSPRECRSILVDPKDLKYKIFMCNKSKAELKGTNALKYIEWGEKQQTKPKKANEKPVFWKDVPSVQGRRYWWGVGERQPANINFNYLIDEVATSYIGNIFVSDNFQEIHTDKNLGTFLNSSVFYLLQANTGRVSFGGGLLKIQTYELKRMLAMETETQDLRYFQIGRKTIFHEYGLDPKSNTPLEEQEPNPLPDRAELDKIVFDALDLTEEERKDVYRSVCRLVWNRISKAKSV